MNYAANLSTVTLNTRNYSSLVSTYLTCSQCRDLLRQQRKIEDAARDWQASGQKTDYLLSKKRLKSAKDFQKEQQEKYPLSELGVSFVTQSIKYQRRERTKFFGLFLIIPLIGTAMVGYFVFKEIPFNADKRLIRECEGKENCDGITDALERLVKANRSFKNFKGKFSLSGYDLSSATLVDADLSSVNLSNSNLSNAHLWRAHLWRADLSEADLSEANLDQVNCKDAKLGKANIKGSKLIDCKNLTFSQIKSACNWEQAIYRGYFDSKKSKWMINEQANQEYIEELKQDKASAPKEPVDCHRWK